MHFILKRTGIALVTVFLVSVLSFLMFAVLPGDPVSYALGTNATEEQAEALREEAGLNMSVPRRYINWLGNFLSGGDIYSFRFRGNSVSAMIQERLPVNLALAFLSLFFILIITIPASVLSARRPGGAIDRLINIFAAFGVSIPGFFLGIIFIWIFGITLKLFTPGVYIGYRENFFGFLFGLSFPALAIAIPNAAMLVKFIRAALIRELKSDYARTAFSKGASFSRVLYHHALRNALVTSVTVLGMIIAEIFSGSIVIEQVFTIPGIGRLLVAAIMSRDYPLIQSLVVYIAWTVVFANLLVDIAIQIIDPRIRLEHSRFRDARK
ncbi:MAG TPA: ABC transporter permease [Treponema sp.]|nr:ABC transporter permease [Treponema sp.]